MFRRVWAFLLSAYQRNTIGIVRVTGLGRNKIFCVRIWRGSGIQDDALTQPWQRCSDIANQTKGASYGWKRASKLKRHGGFGAEPLARPTTGGEGRKYRPSRAVDILMCRERQGERSKPRSNLSDHIPLDIWISHVQLLIQSSKQSPVSAALS